MSLANGVLMARTKETRVLIAESGSPWFSLVVPTALETVVIAQTPDERKTDFDRRVRDRLDALEGARATDVLLVRRRHEVVTARTQWTVEPFEHEKLSAS